MLESSNVIKPLPAGKWTVKIAAGSGVPFIQEEKTGTKKWCMHVFQESAESSSSAPVDATQAPDLDLENVTEHGEKNEKNEKKDGVVANAVPTHRAGGLH